MEIQHFKNFITESPDTIYADVSDAITFIYWSSKKEFYDVLETHGSKTKSIDSFVKDMKIKFPLLVWIPNRGPLYFNKFNSHETIAEIHSGIMEAITYMVDESYFDTYAMDGNSSRAAGTTSGRLSKDTIAFWSDESKVSKDTIDFIIKTTKSKMKFDPEVEIELAPKGDKSWDYEDIEEVKYTYNTKKKGKKENHIPADYSEPDIINMVRKKKWPGLKFESELQKLFKQLNESPDSIYSYSDAMSFIIFKDADELLDSIVSYLKVVNNNVLDKIFGTWNLYDAKQKLEAFLKQNKAKGKNLVVWADNKKGQLYFNKHKTKVNGQATGIGSSVTHYQLINLIVYGATESEDAIDYLGAMARTWGITSGRITFKTNSVHKNGLVSFWTDESYMPILLSKTPIKFPEEIGVETAPKGDKAYSYGEGPKSVYTKPSKKKNTPMKKTKSAEIGRRAEDNIDAIRRRMFPGAVFESKFVPLYEKLMKSMKDGDAYVEIFKNPSSKELADCDMRGVVDKDGNLYTYSRVKEGWMPAFTWIHENIIERAKLGNPDEFYGFDGEPISGVTVASIPGKKFEWYLGESMFYKQKPSEETLNAVRDILKKAEKKTGYKFFMQNLSGGGYAKGKKW